METTWSLQLTGGDQDGRMTDGNDLESPTAHRSWKTQTPTYPSEKKWMSLTVRRMFKLFKSCVLRRLRGLAPSRDGLQVESLPVGTGDDAGSVVWTSDREVNILVSEDIWEKTKAHLLEHNWKKRKCMELDPEPGPYFGNLEGQESKKVPTLVKGDGQAHTGRRGTGRRGIGSAGGPQATPFVLIKEQVCDLDALRFRRRSRGRV